MPEVDAKLVLRLRTRTCAGMSLCKKALVASGGDIEGAVDWLRVHGGVVTASRGEREALSGAVCVMRSDDARLAVILELCAETDFVARNDVFQSYLRVACEEYFKLSLVGCATVETLKSVFVQEHGATLEGALSGLMLAVGEKIVFGRCGYLHAENGVIGRYLHTSYGRDIAKIGALVAIEADGGLPEKQPVLELADKIALHVVAKPPIAVSVDKLDQSVIDRERSVIMEQLASHDKPQHVLRKIVDGKMRGFYEESVLLEQKFVQDEKLSVAQYVEQVGDGIGAKLRVADFILYERN